MTANQSPSQVDELITLSCTCIEQIPGSRIIARLLPTIFRILAEGRPAAAEELASATGWPVHEVTTVLAQFPGVELDSHGRVLGVAMTLLPTPHRVLIPDQDHTLYAWCATDALFFPALLGKPVRIISPCHATRQPINVEVGPEGVQAVQPADAAVSLIVTGDPSDVRGSICAHGHFFVSEDAAAKWLTEHPDGSVVSVADAFRYGTGTIQQCLAAAG